MDQFVSKLWWGLVWPTPRQWPLYRWNWWTALLHGIQCAVVIGITAGRLAYIMPDVPYVSGTQALRVTNHAMIRIDANRTQCDDVRNSPMYKQPFKHAFPSDLMHKGQLYDFTNTFVVEYNTPGVHINTGAVVCVYFFLACVFQIWNGEVLNHSPETPRVITYLEYSLSSSLMMVLLGVNVGILELYQLMGLFGLFFGMNMLGACAELLCYSVEHNHSNLDVLGISMYDIWLIPHIAGWGLFLIAYVPVFVKFCFSWHCSEPLVPWFLITAVILEFLCFVAFGCVQFWGMCCRIHAAVENHEKEVTDAMRWMDAWNIGLSFFAKTSLAWLLLGPALAVDVSVR